MPSSKTSLTTPDVPVRAKHPIGRPTKYREEYCKQVVALGKDGKSQVQIACALNIDPASLRDWAKKYPAFALALTRAHAESQSWWERKGQESLGEKSFQALVWKVSMQARFRDDYTERKEISGGLTIVLPDDVKAGL